MFINKIILENFRNYKHCEINFKNNINFFIGDNAQGKTNLIEAIYFFAFLKSYRTNKIDNLIKNKESFSNITAYVNKNNVENKLFVSLEKNKRKVFLNNKICENNTFFNIIKIIFFYPEEIVLINNFPQKRRNFIDKSIFTIDNRYSVLYNKYIKILKNRNACLKNNKEDSIWLEKFIECSSLILHERINYIERVNNVLLSISENYNFKEAYKITYENYTKENYIQELKKKYYKNKKREFLCGHTLFGPHTDNFEITIDGKNIRSYASEGQKKTFLILYKFAQLIDYKNIYNEYPILVLDDISNELDSKREAIVLNELKKECQQLFITSTTNKNSDNEDVFLINGGNVSKFMNYEVL